MDLSQDSDGLDNQLVNVQASFVESPFVDLKPEELCYIDDETSRTLELLQNNVDPSNKRHSLFGYLNSNTSTTSGTRLIREHIKRPFCHLPTIEHRLDCIEYLLARVDHLSNITNCLKKFGQNLDLDQVIQVIKNLFKTRSSTLLIAEKRMDALLTLESLVAQVPALICALEGSDQPTLIIYKIALEDPAYEEILSDIQSVIEVDVRPGKGKRDRMFCLKSGIEKLFDIARSTYRVAIDDLDQYVRELRKEDNLNWKLSHGESKGYYLTLTVDSNTKNMTLSPKYIRVNRTRNLISCTTRELMQSNVRANVSYENSMKLANEILVNVLASIMTNMGAIQKLINVVTMLDVITSFAKLALASNGSLVRPRFTPTDTIISKAKHPVLESVLNVNGLSVVPNDINFSVGHKNVMLVTGPNMGGKSIFLKQVALIQIMAQLGCYVPAESAHLKLMNRIVARSGTTDDNKSNCSSFMWEMRGVASALLEDKSMPNQSVMYIIDEVGRGTSIDDGASYSFAIAEELASRRNSFTVFATHFDQVFTLTSLYRNVIAYHFEYEGESRSDDGKPRYRISHSLVPGIAEKNHYGFRLAETCGFPDEILNMARKDLNIQV